MAKLGNLFILSAPSGAGKSSLIKALIEQRGKQSVQVSVSHTTRAPRPGEENGVHYHFVDQSEFKTLIEDGAFFEWAEVFGNYYGTSKQAIESQLAQGIDVFLDIDWQGARQVKDMMPQAIGIFILPPSKQELERRLNSRGQDSSEIIAKRMDEAVSEMSHYHEFDYLVVNQDFDTALAQIAQILDTSQLKMHAQSHNCTDLLKDLLAND